MKKISFIVLMTLMLFLGISAAAKIEDLTFDKYTGEALSDDYEDGNGIATQGAIIVDPGMGGSSDDEFEMNDTLATAKSINPYLSYDDNNKCKFVKYLSIANHPNGNADIDCFYFTNSYVNKYFSVSIDAPDFFQYYISLYSVQNTSRETKYVYVGNSSTVMNYSNLEIGSYIIKVNSRNNTQSNYCITVSLERQNSNEYQENNSEANATTIYEDIEKTLKPHSSYAFMKFYPSKTGQYNLYWNSFNIEDIEIYEYVNYRSNFDQGTYKKLYQLYDCKSKINLVQHKKNAEKKFGYEGEHQYFICAKLKNNGNAFLRITYSNITYYDYTRTLSDTKPKELLYPMDDLTVFTTIYDESNIENNAREIFLYDKLTNDFPSNDEKYNNVYGGKNLETINLESTFDNSMMAHLDIYRFATIDYIYEEDGDGESYITQAQVNYMRFAVLENTSGDYTKIKIIVLMNYTYTYLYDTNSLFLNKLTSFISLESFSGVAFSLAPNEIDCVGFNIGASANKKMIVYNLKKELLDEAIAKVVGIASSAASTLYDAINIGEKIAYAINQKEEINAAIKKQLPSSAISGEMDVSTSVLRKSNIEFHEGIYYDNLNNLNFDMVSPYYPTSKEIKNGGVDALEFEIISVGEKSLVDKKMSYFMTFKIHVPSINGKEYYYDFNINRN